MTETVKLTPPAEPVIHVLIDCTLAIAAHTAYHRLNWERTKIPLSQRAAAFDPEGYLVRFVSSAHLLADLPSSSKIYLGKSWIFVYGNVRQALDAHRARGGEVVDLHL